MLNKLDHLHHLEDLCFFGEESAKEAYKALLRADKFFIKYDGCPALVFGYHPNTHKFFLSTKSFFNKTPKINYDEEDIVTNHGKNENLTLKLKSLFPLMRDFFEGYSCFDKHCSLYQADLLLTEDTINSDNEFTPNLITYKIKYPETLSYKLGLALHTRYDLKLNKNYPISSWSMDEHPTDVYIAQRDIYFNPRTYPQYSKMLYELSLMLDNIDYDGLSEKSISQVNKIIRSGQKVTFDNLDFIKCDNFKKAYLMMRDTKEYLIQMLDMTNKFYNLKMKINDKECGHEGYVIRTIDTYSPVKLVLRDTFSRCNFEKNG